MGRPHEDYREDYRRFLAIERRASPKIFDHFLTEGRV